MDISTLPSIKNAPFPAKYSAARQALAECSKIDECKTWADKAQAMASYAKQSRDDTLHKMATRIKARAIRRCGELLEQIEPSKGGRPPSETADRTVSSLGRTQAARDAGLSERQQVTATRVANVPADEFEAAVESDNPPTITELAEAGKKPKPKPEPESEQLVDLKGIPPEFFQMATGAAGALRRLAEFCEQHQAVDVAQGFRPSEVARVRRHIETIDQWLDVFILNLPEGNQ